MQRAAIFVPPEDPEPAIAACRAACERHSWHAPADRIATFDPDHPDQGLPVVLFTSTSAPVRVLVVPDWGVLARGLLGGVYHTEPNVKGRDSRIIGTGLLTAQRFFDELEREGILVHVVAEDRTFEPATVAQHLRAAYEPLMASAREWDATTSRNIRAGQDRAWSEGRRVGRPPRKDDDAT